jgi:hypothetical protein
MAATTISAAMRTMTIHSRYSPVGKKKVSKHNSKGFANRLGSEATYHAYASTDLSAPATDPR